MMKLFDDLNDIFIFMVVCFIATIMFSAKVFEILICIPFSWKKAKCKYNELINVFNKAKRNGRIKEKN